MKQIVLLTSFLMLMFEIVYCQSAPGFNKRFTIDSGDATIYRLIVENDTIVAMGSIAVDTALWGNGMVLMKFDTNGNLLQSKLIVDSLIGQLPIELRYGNFQPTPDGGYLMTLNPFIYEYPVLLKTDHEFNVEFFKYYNDSTAYNYRLCDFTPIHDGYLLFGSLNWNQDNSDGYVRKIGLDGENKWVKYFGYSGTDDVVYDIEPINDSTFLVATGHGTGFGGIAYNAFRILGDNGNVLQTWNSEPDPETGYLRDIISVDSNGYLVYGLYSLAFLPPFDYLVQSTISRLDQDFNVLWSKHYGKKVTLSSEIMFYDFERTVDGNYVGVGRTSIDQPNTSALSCGWLMKFSPEGDSIWSRLDLSDFQPVVYINSHRLGGVGVLSSGSIIAGGYARRQNDYYAWLIKVTNDGCLDTLYCGLVSGAEEKEESTNQALVVYPNPANDVLTIVPRQPNNAGFEVLVFDATGKHQVAWAGDGEATLTVSSLPAGIYFMVVKFPDGKVLYEKISVLH